MKLTTVTIISFHEGTAVTFKDTEIGVYTNQSFEGFHPHKEIYGGGEVYRKLDATWNNKK